MILLTIAILMTTSAQTGRPSRVEAGPPPANNRGGEVCLFELRGSGDNNVCVRAPDSIASNVLWKLPAADQAGCLKSDGAGALSISACLSLPTGAGVLLSNGSGGYSFTTDYVTRTTEQNFVNGITKSKTFAGPEAELIGVESLGVERWRLTLAGQARFTMRDTSGSNTVVDIQGGASQGEIWTSAENAFGTANRAAGLSGNAAIAHRLMLTTDPTGFTFRGFEVPSGAFGTVLWKLPVADASGCLKSDGAGNLSISACLTGGVSQITSSAPIQAAPSTGNVVLSCPTCDRTDQYQVFLAGKTFSQQQLDFRNGFNGQMVLITPNGILGFGGTTTGRITVSQGSGSFTTPAVDLDGAGVNVVNGAAFRVDGSNGIDLTCGAGAKLSQPVIRKGIIISGGCAF